MTAETPPTSSLRATAHPVRLQILSLLTGAPMSAAEIARELDISHANASYHLRFLADSHLVVEAGEEKIRGGVAKRYRHPWDAKPVGGGSATDEDRMLYARSVGEELVRRLALKKKGTRAAISDAELWVVPEVWAQVQALVEQASTLIHAEAQPPRSPGTVHVNLTAATFEMDDTTRTKRTEGDA
jgi:DNA-binding transcriptional ArsR family regulator